MATSLNNSVLRAFEILALLSKARPEISAAFVSQQLQLNSATAHRFLLTLEAAGALRTTKRGYFALGPKIDELGQVSEDTGAIGIVLQPELEGLSADLHESVMVSKLARRGPTCVAVVNSSRAISVNITVGTVLPFHASAQGKLWLAAMDADSRAAYLGNARIAGNELSPAQLRSLSAELDLVAKRGFATNLGDNEPDIAAVAVPVRNSTGKMTLSLSTFGLLGRFDQSFIDQAQHKLRLSAAKIAELLR